MAFRIEPAVPLVDEIARIGDEQFARLESVVAGGLEEATDVHGVRKTLKRIRSLVRLAREVLGDDAYRVLNVRARDMGRRLAAARDCHVTMTMFEHVATATDGLAARAVEDVRKRLLARVPDQQTVDAAAALATVQDLKQDWVRAIAARPSPPDTSEDWQRLIRGLAKTYARARDALSLARMSNDAEHVHELRKAIQHHGRHMTLLGPAWPDHFRARSRSARHIATVLGEDHDLAVLRTWLGLERPSMTPRSARVVDLIDARSANLQTRMRREALPLVHQLLAASTKAISRETLAIVEAARTSQATAP